MLSVEDFVSKFKNYNDEELFEIYKTIEDYSEEAKEAFNTVIVQKGGIEVLKEKNQKKKYAESEIERIRKETLKLSVNGNDIDFLKKMISSNSLPQEIVNQTIEKAFSETVAETEDKKIKSRTVLGGIFGTIIAGIFGGILWGLQMIYSNRIFYLLFIGLILLCYGIIRLLTKQSYKNKVVIIATVLSVIIALMLGSLLFDIVGLLD